MGSPSVRSAVSRTTFVSISRMRRPFNTFKTSSTTRSVLLLPKSPRPFTELPCIGSRRYTHQATQAQRVPSHLARAASRTSKTQTHTPHPTLHPTHTLPTHCTLQPLTNKT